jgi:septal ring factor EnvC (AmiA/AmiB activator)
MLIRISLIIAIIAALAVGVLNFIKVKEKITTLISERDEWQRKYTETDAELTLTKNELEKTSKELEQTKETLVATTAAKDRVEAQLAQQTQRANELTQRLTQTTSERDDARAQLGAYTGTGFTPPQIIAFGKQIKDAQDALEVVNEEKKILAFELAKKKAELAKILDPKYIVPLPPNLKGTVLVADPKWDFVVLDFGTDQNVLQDGELLVSRNGKLVAKLRISSVEKNRCIANVIPGWRIGDVMEGDVVMAAHPAS